MRVFALSDVHVDYGVNSDWIGSISTADFVDDVLILAGDVSDTIPRLGRCLEMFALRFRQVLFVPGNHDLWVIRDPAGKTSLEKFADVASVVAASGASLRPFQAAGVSIVPLLGWYDYSFGEPGPDLKAAWMDFHACRWPADFEPTQVTEHFLTLNETAIPTPTGTVITFSHFLPRIDVMPERIPKERRWLYPVLGADRLDQQLRRAGASIHVYGHSHVHRRVSIDGVTYLNNALGYPHETWIASRDLLCVHNA